MVTISQRRNRRRHAAFRLGVVACAVLSFHLDVAPAFAQERRTLLDMLFGDRRPAEREDEYLPRQRDPRLLREPRQRNRTTRVAPPAPVPPSVAVKPEPVEKFADARRILVMGDFTASSLSTGLQEAFQAVPSVVVEDHGEPASGLVREDHYEWDKELSRLLAEKKPTIVVVMIGANDRQQMQFGENREKFRSEKWLQEYEKRVSAVIDQVARLGIPLLWVGLPAFQSPSLSADAVTLNGIYREQVEKAGGEFVDIWDGFVNEDGDFIVTGSDINGQQVRLRGSDGVSFTAAGRRKLAFYVEKFARRHLGELSVGDLIRLDAGNLPLLSSLPPESEAKVISQPINLSDPNLDGGKELLGTTNAANATSDANSPRNMLLTKGTLPAPPVGRVDYYQVDVTASTSR